MFVFVLARSANRSTSSSSHSPILCDAVPMIGQPCSDDNERVSKPKQNRSGYCAVITVLRNTKAEHAFIISCSSSSWRGRPTEFTSSSHSLVLVWLLLVFVLLLTVRVHPSCGFCATNELADLDGSVAQLAGLGILGFANPARTSRRRLRRRCRQTAASIVLPIGLASGTLGQEDLPAQHSLLSQQHVGVMGTRSVGVERDAGTRRGGGSMVVDRLRRIRSLKARHGYRGLLLYNRFGLFCRQKFWSLLSRRWHTIS